MIRALAFAALAAAAVLRAARAAAAPECEATVQIEVPGEDPVLEISTTESTCTASGNSGPAFMIGDGGADFGTLYAHSEATFLTGETDQVFSSVAVEWRDTITVESPGLAGASFGLVGGDDDGCLAREEPTSDFLVQRRQAFAAVD